MKPLRGGPGNFPVSCALGFGEAWVEPIEGEAEREGCKHLIVRVPSRPDDIESKPRDYVLVLDEDARRELARQLTDANPGGLRLR